MNEVIERPQAAVPAAPAESSNLTQAIISAAHDPRVNIEKMERLLSMHERIAARDAEGRFNAAMVIAQASMGRVSADAVNPQTRSQYATYAQLDRHLRPIFTGQGFSLSFNTGADAPEGHVRVVCYVSHSSGHTRTYQCDMPADGKGAKGNDVMTKTHASGSAMSYGMRYLLKLIFNVAIGEDDDDGNRAGKRGGEENLRDAWIGKAAAASTVDALQRISKEGSRAFSAAKDPAGYREFAEAVQRHGAALRKKEVAHA